MATPNRYRGGELARVRGTEPSQVRRRMPTVRGAFDAAQTTDKNRNHWSLADGLSADAAGRPEVRKTLIRRSRYEIANNSYAAGIKQTMVNDCVGTGPRLQLTTPDEAINERIERAFADWAREIDLAAKLRVMRGASIESGEGLMVQTVNPGLRSPVKLDFKVVECDRLTAPYLAGFMDSEKFCDGIFYDDWGNPTEYNILRYHPGSTYGFSPNPAAFDRIDAKFVYHLFKKLRPEQRRGLPEMTPALPLFAIARRYTLASISAAEAIADISVLVKSQGPAVQGEPGDTSYEAGDTFQLERGTGMFLPEGTDIAQPKAEQPTTTYPQFINAILREIGRCLNVPFTVAALDSSTSNLSAAYLDRQAYANAIGIDRSQIDDLLEWILTAWLDYASLLPQFDGLLSLEIGHNHSWLWPSLGHHADPAKTANSQMVKLRMGLTDLATEQAREGREFEKSLKNQAKALGIPVEQLQQLLINNIYPPPKGFENTDQPTDDGKKEPAPQDQNEPALDDD